MSDNKEFDFLIREGFLCSIRGQFALTVLTKARAEQDGVPMRADAVLFSLLNADDSAIGTARIRDR